MPSTMLSTPNRPIKVVVVDDHYLIRHAIRDMFASQETVELVGEGAVGEDILPLVEQHEPDVLLLDLAMPQNHLDTDEKFLALPMIAQLRRRWPPMAIIILSAYLKPNIIHGAIKLGVPGYLLKSDDLSRELPTAVVSVYQGSKAFSRTVLDKLVQEPELTQIPSLTARQIEVLAVMAKMPDAPYLELAGQLNITVSTLKKHLTKAYQTLGVRNNKAAIMRCIELGIIPGNDEDGEGA